MGAALIPTDGGQANVSVGVPMARLRRRADPARWFAARLAEAAPELAAAVAGYAGRRYPTFVGLPGFARRSWGRAGRWSATPPTAQTRSAPTA